MLSLHQYSAVCPCSNIHKKNITERTLLASVGLGNLCVLVLLDASGNTSTVNNLKGADLGGGQ